MGTNKELLFWENPEAKKQCDTCFETLPIQQFYLNKLAKDGRAYRCVICEKTYAVDARARKKKLEDLPAKRKSTAGAYNKKLKRLRQEDKEAFIKEYTHSHMVYKRSEIQDLHNILKSITTNYAILNHDVFKPLKK